MLEKAAGTYTVYVWESNNPNIPVGETTFTMSKVGDQGKVTMQSVSVTTNEPQTGALSIAGDLTDVFAAGFIKFLGNWRFIFQDIAKGGSSPSFTANFYPNGLIDGSYTDSNGGIKFTNSTKDVYTKSVPKALSDLAGEYTGNGYFFISGPLDLNIYTDGTVSFTDPSSCSVKNLQWDGNSDIITAGGGQFRISDADGNNQVNFSYDQRGLWEFRIGTAGGTNIYRMDTATAKLGNPAGPLIGTNGLSICTARKNDTTPPVITLPADLVVHISDLTGYKRDTVINYSYLNAPKAVDTLTSGFTEKVAVTNDLALNTLPIGDTVVTFTATDKQGNTATAQGKITVIYDDTEKPVVTAPTSFTVAAVDANGTPKTNASIASFLAGASAQDNRDGALNAPAINAPAVFSIGETIVTFEATDSSGNKGIAKASVTVADQTPPVITLNGDNPLKVTQNTTYSEAGALAVDNVSGTIGVNAIQIDTSALDLATVGTYTITYSATDNAGNKGTVSRTVEVVAPKAFSISLKNPSPTQNHLNKVVYGNKFVAVGDKGTIVTSSDGIAWQTESCGVSTNIKDICWDGKRYAAVTYDTSSNVLFSNDASNWTVVSNSGISQPLLEIECKPNKWVARAQNLLYYSADGTNWNQAATNISSMLSLNYINSQFIAQSNQAIYSSTDGIAWTAKTPLANTKDITWDGSQYVLVGSVYNSSFRTFQPAGATSTDLASYSSITPNSLAKSIDFLNGKYIVLGLSVGELDVSSDLSSWNKPSIFQNDGANLNGVSWNQNATSPVYVAVGDNGFIYSSSDAASWTARHKNIVTSDLKQAAYDASAKIAVAVGKTGTIVKSSDLSNWSVATSGITTDLNAVVYGNQFIAVGAGGVILTSPDGSTWTAQTSGTNLDLSTVAWNGGIYLAASGSKAVATSTDGISWTLSANNSYPGFQNVYWDGSQWVAHNGANLWTSSDTTTWTDQGYVTGSGGISAVEWDGSNYWAVGTNGGGLFKNTGPANLTYTNTAVGGYPTDIIWDSSAGQFVLTKQEQLSKFTSVQSSGVMTSADGINWSQRGDSSLTFYDVQQAGDSYILVGKAGLIAIGK